MARKIIDTKIRTLIKAYLVFNKGKKCTAKEIAEWINNGGFALNQYSCHPKVIGYHVNAAKYNVNSQLYGVKVEKVRNLNHYWVEA